jgi:hypothetical protein
LFTIRTPLLIHLFKHITFSKTQPQTNPTTTVLITIASHLRKARKHFHGSSDYWHYRICFSLLHHSKHCWAANQLSAPFSPKATSEFYDTKNHISI